MSTARLNIWITETGDPCRISPAKHKVYVLHCNGDILEWCKDGKPFKYADIPTDCGHLELEIPPGCYVVGAVMSGGVRSTKWLGNHLTHIAVVRANCGDDICVTLFEPSLYVCGTWIGAAINTHIPGGGVGVGGGVALTDQQIATMRNARTAVEAMLKVLPPDPLAVTTAALALPRRKGQVGEAKAKAKKR